LQRVFALNLKVTLVKRVTKINRRLELQGSGTNTVAAKLLKLDWLAADLHPAFHVGDAVTVDMAKPVRCAGLQY
jgi:hypothetical protein